MARVRHRPVSDPPDNSHGTVPARSAASDRVATFDQPRLWNNLTFSDQATRAGELRPRLRSMKPQTNGGSRPWANQRTRRSRVSTTSDPKVLDGSNVRTQLDAQCFMQQSWLRVLQSRSRTCSELRRPDVTDESVVGAANWMSSLLTAPLDPRLPNSGRITSSRASTTSTSNSGRSTITSPSPRTQPGAHRNVQQHRLRLEHRAEARPDGTGRHQTSGRADFERLPTSRRRDCRRNAGRRVALGPDAVVPPATRPPARCVTVNGTDQLHHPPGRCADRHDDCGPALRGAPIFPRIAREPGSNSLVCNRVIAAGALTAAGRRCRPGRRRRRRGECECPTTAADQLDFRIWRILRFDNREVEHRHR